MAVLKKCFAALLLPALTLALPQASTSDIPPCAYSAVLSSLQKTGCDLTDTACVCSQPGLAEQVTSAVVDACTGSVSEDEVTSFITEYCGGTTPPAAASTTSTPVPSPETTSEAPETTSEATSTTTPTASNTTTSNSTTNSTTTWTLPLPSSTDAPMPSEGDASMTRMSTIAFAVALGGMTWIFSEF